MSRRLTHWIDIEVLGIRIEGLAIGADGAGLQGQTETKMGC